MNLNSAPAYENRKISLQNCRPIASTDCRFLVASVAHVWAALHGLASFKFQSCLAPRLPHRRFSFSNCFLIVSLLLFRVMRERRC